MTTTELTKPRPAEDTLIDALRGCRDVKELKALEQRLASTTDAPPLFTWICDLLVARRISRGLAARLLFELHNGDSKEGDRLWRAAPPDCGKGAADQAMNHRRDGTRQRSERTGEPATAGEHHGQS